MSSDSSQPWLHQHGRQVQLFGTVRQFPLGLSYEVRLDLPAPTFPGSGRTGIADVSDFDNGNAFLEAP